MTWRRSTARIVVRNYCTTVKNARTPQTYRRNSVEPAGLRIPIIMLWHMTRARAKQILSPCVVALQVSFRFEYAALWLNSFTISAWESHRHASKGKENTRI